MTIASIVLVVVIALLGLLVAGLLIYGAVEEKSKGLAAGAALVFVLTAAICIWLSWYQLNSESGKRAYKDQQSELNGGIERVVQVYDAKGEMIREYSGRFDVETDKDSYILFDDEEGKRHIVYFTTGTIIIDEK